MFLLGLAGAIFGLRFSRFPQTSHAVLIEPFGMGDVISLRPMIDRMAGHFERVTVIVKREWQALLPSRPNLSVLDLQIPWAGYSRKQKYSMAALVKVFEPAKLALYRDLISGAVGFDPRGDVRSIVLLNILGCSRVYTLDHYLGTDMRLPPCGAVRTRIRQNQRRSDIASGLFEAVSGCATSAGERPKLLTQERSVRCIRRISLIPCAPWAGRLWPDERWVELHSRLRTHGFEVSGLCGPGQTDAARRALGAVGTLKQARDVLEWIALLDEVDLVVTVDSGPMHLADALDIPLVALFGPGQLPMWAPSGKMARMVHHQNAQGFRPCHQVNGNEDLGRHWMNRITVDEVFSAVETLCRECAEDVL